MRYDELISEFKVDGSLRDIYALHTNIADWDRLLSLLHELGDVSYYCDGERAPLPSTASLVFEDADHQHLLRLDLGGPVINTHFFCKDEIELDLDPREIASQADLDTVLNFCARIGREIKRDIRITPEGSPDIIYLYYSAEQDTWQRLGRV